MKLLSEALGEALALVDKATPGKLYASDIDGNYCVHREITTPGGAGFMTDTDVWNMEDAEAVAASINFLRQHGPAIAAALRAVEGATNHTVYRYPGVGDGLVRCDFRLIGQRVALVPLDAAGSAEGVSDADG